MVEAARKYNRICQAGTQSRSNPGMREAIAYVHGGKIGKVDLACGLCYKRAAEHRQGRTGEQTAARRRWTTTSGAARPAEDAAPQRRKNGTGPLRLALDLGLRQRRPRQPGHPRDGQGPLGPEQDDACPTRVVSVGGRFGYVDDGETANTQICLFDYGDAKLIFEVRGLHDRERTRARGVGNIWFGDEGLRRLPELRRRRSPTTRTARNASTQVQRAAATSTTSTTSSRPSAAASTRT